MCNGTDITAQSISITTSTVIGILVKFYVEYRVDEHVLFVFKNHIIQKNHTIVLVAIKVMTTANVLSIYITRL